MTRGKDVFDLKCFVYMIKNGTISKIKIDVKTTYNGNNVPECILPQHEKITYRNGSSNYFHNKMIKNELYNLYQEYRRSMIADPNEKEDEPPDECHDEYYGYSQYK